VENLLTNLVYGVLGLLLAFGVVLAAPYLTKYGRLLKVITAAVKEAEKQYGFDGAEKLAHAYKYVQDWLDARGWGFVDVERIVALIEAEVIRIYNKDKLIQ
jgi:predicted TPR repeat methyltransferase